MLQIGIYYISCKLAQTPIVAATTKPSSKEFIKNKFRKKRQPKEEINRSKKIAFGQKQSDSKKGDIENPPLKKEAIDHIRDPDQGIEKETEDREKGLVQFNSKTYIQNHKS